MSRNFSKGSLREAECQIPILNLSLLKVSLIKVEIKILDRDTTKAIIQIQLLLSKLVLINQRQNTILILNKPQIWGNPNN